MEQFTKANFWYQPSFHGVDLSALRGAAVDEYFRQPIVDTFDMRILMAESVKYAVNFLEAKEADLHRIEIPFKFHMLHSGLVHGLAFGLSRYGFRGLSDDGTHCPAPSCLLPTRRQSYDINIATQMDQTGSKSSNLLDLKNPFFRYTGTTPTPPAGSHYTSPSENMWSSGVAYSMNQGMAVSVNAGIVNHTHSRMGSIMSTGIMQGASTGQSGLSSSSPHYPINSQFTMVRPPHLHGLPNGCP
ncbi:hypothetical protein GJAV_G00265170 [Gymnothorax javanicus]|nr:hypothetical protein GJAV_G00265170 [Gymnothorax javanicus]